jgi:hypothetical protein
MQFSISIGNLLSIDFDSQTPYQHAQKLPAIETTAQRRAWNGVTDGSMAASSRPAFFLRQAPSSRTNSLPGQLLGYAFRCQIAVTKPKTLRKNHCSSSDVHNDALEA